MHTPTIIIIVIIIVISRVGAPAWWRRHQHIRIRCVLFPFCDVYDI